MTLATDTIDNKGVVIKSAVYVTPAEMSYAGLKADGSQVTDLQNNALISLSNIFIIQTLKRLLF